MSEELKKQDLPPQTGNLSRREFMAAAGVAATALVVTPILSLPPKSAPKPNTAAVANTNGACSLT